MTETFKDVNFKLGEWLSSPPPGDEVVITGMSGRLPNSNNIKEYCDHLFNKEEMISGDDRRWNLNHPEIPQRTAKIYNIDKFDTGYFGLHYRQANFMDAMLRSMLETSIEAIMDAGVNPAELAGTNTGVFISASWSDMETETLCNLTEPESYAATGFFRFFLAQRISYFLKLKTVSFIADTACSSYLNAFECAFKAIRNGQCENAIVGGANLLLHPGNSLQFFRLGVLSYDGVCRVFDQDAKGYVRGETVACLFLQKAKNSKRIYARIINCKANSDGYKDQGITFPSTQAQTQLMKEIYHESNIHPDQISYLEAHGTGTQVGDPQEVEAIDLAVAQNSTKQLLVGSVKSNIGHTEPASGICSVIKVLLAMETDYITPNINLKKIKQGMKGFEEGRMKVVTELTKLQEDNAIIGVNNFGFGGSNCHTILQRISKKKSDICYTDDSPRLICVSGRTKQAVQKLLDDIQTQKFDVEYIGLLHQLFKKNFEGHLYRGYIIISKKDTLKTSYQFYPGTKSSLYVFFGQFVDNFNILGQYLQQFEIFKNIIARIDNILTYKNMKPFENLLENNTENYEKILGSICVQIAIVEILKQLQLFPTAVYADSYGKLISSYYYDVNSLEETLSAAIKICQLDFNSDLHFESSFNRTLGNDILTKLPKHNFVLNVSDVYVNNQDILLVENKLVVFLDVLGKLFEQGHNPQIDKLYQPIQFPVSRSTPMISPSIEWNHTKSWFTYKFKEFISSDSEQREHMISYIYEDNRYIQGHVIDGRNLFPATEYLNLVWQTYAQSKRISANAFPVVFTNCKFIRAINMPKSSFVKLLVSVQRGTGHFEVVEKDSLVVTGYIHEYTPDMKLKASDMKPIIFDDKNPKTTLEHDEIYRELYLRGYNYSGIFKGIQKCNIESSAALVKWENNWTTFMDKMLQLKILQNDSRLLFVPTGIKKLIINPQEHIKFCEQFTTESQVELPVFAYKNCNIIKSGGIEISGLQAKSILKKKPRLEPVLEKHQFVPNCTNLDLLEAIRVNIQIVLENNMETVFKAVEILDDSEVFDEKILLPFVSKALDDVPVVSPDLTISTKNEFEKIPGIKFESITLTPESNLTLFLGNKLLQKSNTLKQCLTYIKTNGFILTREAVDYKCDKLEEVDVVTEYTTPNAKLILMKKTQDNLREYKFVDVSSNTWDWIPQLQNYIKSDSDVVLYAKNQNNEGLLGFVNCVRREPNGQKIKCFFMMDDCPDFDLKHDFYREQLSKNLPINIYKNKTWGTYRHLLLEAPSLVETRSCFANVSSIGDLASFKWFEDGLVEDKPLPKNRVFVSSYYSAINFKDVMSASGRVNIESLINSRLEEECFIGFECAGKDLSGRRVTCMIDNRAFATSVMADKEFLWELPDEWSLEEGATIPVVYSTVMYALCMIGNMKQGSSILIHSGTGGIGLAALNVCTYYNCDIYVTVGTQEKREYLRKHYPQIPESHFGNSHDTSFEEMIKTATKNRGVEFVLNSLSEDKLKASIRCLAPGGLFLEIGKFDLANDATFELLLLEKKASYHGIMLDQIFAKSNEKKVRLAKLIRDGIKIGFIKPLPQVIFKEDEIEKAFRYMMTGKHIGKVLIKVRDHDKTDTPVEKQIFKAYPRFYCDPQSSYVILGGLGGIGLELADWLVLRSAKKILLSSRSGIQSGYQAQKINLWKSYGVHVQISTRDITTKQGCIELIKEANKLGPVNAVFNLAVVLKDALFEDQSKTTFIESLAPKAQATIYLDEITRELCPQLKYFVVFSSVSCGRGNAGQTNYGMANSIMERICEKRKAEGLPALAIQWGAIGDVGLVAKMQKENKELVIGGTLQQKILSCLQVLDRFLKQDYPIVSSMIVAEKHDKNYGANSAVEAVAFILGIKELKTLNRQVTLAELGLDSMMGTEVIQILEKDFDIFVTAKDVRSLTFAKLAELEAEKLTELKDVSTSQKVANMILQYMPDEQQNELPIIELSSDTKTDKKTPTVFLFPGLEGVFKPFKLLTSKVKANILGVQYNYKNSENTIEEIASNILPNIESRIIKEIPFTIIAYSFGAAVTVQIVSLLEKKGYTGKIILIDGSPDYLKALAKANFPQESENDFQMAFLVKILSLLLPTDILSEYKEQFLNCKTFEEKIDLAHTLIPSEVINKDKLQKEAALNLYKRYKAVSDYKFNHPKILSDVYLMKAKYSITEQEDYHLSQICSKIKQITTIEGDHASILNQDNLIEVINQIIQKSSI